MTCCCTCGEGSRYAADICGRCAEDWNVAGGKSRINRRRRRNGLSPLLSGGILPVPKKG